jgi:DNA transposition AAA+ family ATPase
MTDEKIQKGLEQDARLDTERNQTVMSLEVARDKAEALNRFMQRYGFSQNRIAKMIGVSTSVVNQFLADKYKGNLGKLVNKVVDLINTVDRRERQSKEIPYVNTTVAMKIAAVIKQTRAFSNKDLGAISLIIGDSGHGKTKCLREYAEVTKNAILIEMDNGMNSTRVFTELANKLGIDSSGSMDNVTRRIIDTLQNRETIVMIDEASGLTVRQLSQLRTIITDKCRCPLVLAGNADLLKTVMQPKTRRGFESLDQFRSRLMAVLNLDIISTSKDDNIFTAEDVRKLYEYGGITLTKDAVGTIRAISKTPQSGRLHTCSRIISAIHRFSAKANKQGFIDADLILEAIEELGLPLKAYLPVVTGISEIEKTEQKAAVAKAG